MGPEGCDCPGDCPCGDPEAGPLEGYEGLGERPF